jgi:transketolase
VRTAFFEALVDMAREDSRVMLVIGEVGFGVAQPFIDEFPDQYVNAGVAEQNMTGMAAGLSLMGKIVFTYSIANFPTLRCLEQIRNDVCYHDTNVRVVSVGGGMAYGALGMSHHAVEDLSILRSLPNLTVIAPGDPAEARLATKQLHSHQGPAYLRLGRAGEPIVHHSDPSFEIGRAIEVRSGRDATLITTGGQLHDSVLAADALEREGLSIQVLSVHTVKPLDCNAVISAARKTGAVFVAEEHSIVGGLGSAVAVTLLEADVDLQHFKRIGLPDRFCSLVGDQEFLRNRHGLDPKSISHMIKTTLSTRGMR